MNKMLRVLILHIINVNFIEEICFHNMLTNCVNVTFFVLIFYIIFVLFFNMFIWC